jgi:hypothetical protein
MRSVRRWLLIVIVALPLMAAGCGGQPSAADLAPTPQPGVIRTEITPEITDIVFLESAPGQVRLIVQGELPNSCSRLGWYVKPGDDQGRIEVALYADQDPNAACIQVVQPYSEPIAIGTFERGSFVVFVNNQQVEEFTVP